MEKIEKNSTKEEDSINQSWSKIRQNIEDAAKEVLGLRTIKQGQITHKKCHGPIMI